jgi:hypothetical protein
MLGFASTQVARVSTAPMAAPIVGEVEAHLNCPLVVIGGELADRLSLANHLTGQKRCTIVVYGASVLIPPVARAGTDGAVLGFPKELDLRKPTPPRRFEFKEPEGAPNVVGDPARRPGPPCDRRARDTVNLDDGSP